MKIHFLSRYLCTLYIHYVQHISYTLVRSQYSMVYIFLFILYTQSNIDWAVWIPVEFKRKSCRRSCSDIFVTAIDRIVQDFTNTKEIKIINILISQGGDGASKSEEDVICCLSGGYKIIFWYCTKGSNFGIHTHYTLCIKRSKKDGHDFYVQPLICLL